MMISQVCFGHKLLCTAAEALTLIASASAEFLNDYTDEQSADSLLLLQNELKMTKVSSPASMDHMVGAAFAETTTTTTPDPTGLSMNAEGDFLAFMSALVANGIMIVGCLGAFSVLRMRYPLIYSNNILKGLAPPCPQPSYFNWVSTSLKCTIPEAATAIGLDNALMLEFSHLCMKITAIIGIPMFFISGPINCAFGGNAAGMDHLSYFSFGNVENGSPLYWFHAVLVWFVVIVIQVNIYKAQDKFLELRFAWLHGMSKTRANTILVEGIPEKYRSDDALKKFFEEMIVGSKVRSAWVVKDTTDLLKLQSAKDAAELQLRIANAKWEKDDEAIDKRPQTRESLLGAKVDAISLYSERVKDLEAKIKTKRADVVKEAKSSSGGVNLQNGFVTFEERYHAALALSVNMTEDIEEWVVSVPPPAKGLLWKDLCQDPQAQTVRTLIGYAMIVGLYFAYMPLVIGITNIAKIIDMGPLQSMWQGLAPTMGLQFMVAFLPTFLNIIFMLFFTLKAEAWMQHRLQWSYFTFQVVFVIFATAVGQDVRKFTETLFAEPFAIFGVLADTMPYATHFYMNFMVLQWVTHAMNITRYVPLMKYLFFIRLFEAEEARKLSEPEDQDYYGIGSRSARWTINMCVCTVFGTLSPPIYVLTFINFAVVRLIYGYLIPFAETRKPDLGGVFWVGMLRGLFWGNLIYCVLMLGVFTRRAATWGPTIIIAPTVIYVLWSFQRFDTKYAWEYFPHTKLMYMKTHSAPPVSYKEDEAEYIQEELLAK